MTSKQHCVHPTLPPIKLNVFGIGVNGPSAVLDKENLVPYAVCINDWLHILIHLIYIRLCCQWFFSYRQFVVASVDMYFCHLKIVCIYTACFSIKIKIVIVWVCRKRTNEIDWPVDRRISTWCCHWNLFYLHILLYISIKKLYMDVFVTRCFQISCRTSSCIY